MHIENAMNYIDMHFMDMLTLDSLAKKAQMSSSYFSQTFKRLNGFSVWEYVLEKRIDCSERLLITTEDPILEIAMKCGFNNATNFNRAFKKITGVSPREYRLQYTG